MHEMGDSQEVGVEISVMSLYVHLGASTGTGSFDGSPFSRNFALNLPPLSCFLLLLSSFLTSESSTVKITIHETIIAVYMYVHA